MTSMRMQAWLASTMVLGTLLTGGLAAGDPSDDTVDQDGDMLSNHLESYLKLSYLDTDSDDDGILDAFDLGLSELNPTLTVKIVELKQTSKCDVTGAGPWDPYLEGSSVGNAAVGSVGFLAPGWTKNDHVHDRKETGEPPIATLQLASNIASYQTDPNVQQVDTGLTIQVGATDHDVSDHDSVSLAGGGPFSVTRSIGIPTGLKVVPYHSSGSSGKCRAEVSLEVASEMTTERVASAALALFASNFVRFSHLMGDCNTETDETCAMALNLVNHYIGDEQEPCVASPQLSMCNAAQDTVDSWDWTLDPEPADDDPFFAHLFDINSAPG